MQKILVSILTCMVLVLIAQTTRAEGDDAKKEVATVAQPLREDFVAALKALLESVASLTFFSMFRIIPDKLLLM